MDDFRISSIPNIRGIKSTVEEFIELNSDKIETLKEEEFKSRYISWFFGDVLGFNYGNSNTWQLREEKKSIVDGTKADAALGYFYRNKKQDEVRAIIEIKNSRTDLDKKLDNLSPVDQAFNYASKMGGKCQWVIVSNIKEIRFYPSLDRSKCQVFFLKELIDNKKLSELLFLFHKHRFIKKEGESQTDILFEKSKKFGAQISKPKHIIDKIHDCLTRFDGFGFVDPNYVAAIYPFNILDEYVWHYHRYTLFTINHELYNLLIEIKVVDGQVLLSEKLEKETKSWNVFDAKYKLETAFSFMNKCGVFYITAIKDYERIAQRNKKTIGYNIKYQFDFDKDEGLVVCIKMNSSEECDCIICNYRNLNFNRFFQKLKVADGDERFSNLEYAYGNYLAATNNFKSTYTIYKTIERTIKGKEGKEIEYFLAKQNIKRLHNLIWNYRYGDSHEILENIKVVDLDKVIYDEIEFSVDKEVKDYLVRVKEDDLIYKLQDEIEETVYEIEKLKKLYDNNGIQHLGPSLPDKLIHAHYLLYRYVSGNFIIYDIFKRYRNLTTKVFRGLITSYLTRDWGLKKFPEFILTEATFHISPSALKEILADVDVLKTENDITLKFIEKLKNYFSSYFKDGIFSYSFKDPLIQEYIINDSFCDKYTDIFSNIFTIFSRLEFTKDDFKSPKPSLLKFLTIETELHWYDLEQFALFLNKKGDFFTQDELVEILKIAIERDRYGYNKYDLLIEWCSKVISKFYPDYRLHNIKLINLAIINATSDNDRISYGHLKSLVNICSDKCRQILLNAFAVSSQKDEV